MLDEKQTGLLRDILDSALTVHGYLAGVSFEQFADNLEKQDAVLRRFEIIGEAASQIEPPTRTLFPDVPFKSMRGMCNIIAHDYGNVDVEQVWQTASRDLPNLIRTLQKHFGET